VTGASGGLLAREIKNWGGRVLTSAPARVVQKNISGYMKSAAKWLTNPMRRTYRIVG